MNKAPVLFLGHGSPMNTIEKNRYTEAWQKLGTSLTPPRALLVISAHWFIDTTAVTAMARPRVIHDFYGFPEELFAFDYPAPGLPELAEEISEIVKPQSIELDQGEWGLDHGTWSVLAHLYPQANIPVVQLSINAQKPLDYHLKLAALLAPLRERGVIILSSGNVVHNLRNINWKMHEEGTDWAYRFDDAVATHMAHQPSEILRVTEHPDFKIAVPTPDHFIPLLYTAGLAAAENVPARPLLRGCTLGSLSMSCYGIGLDEMFSKD